MPPDTYQPIITSMLTPEDSKRVADAAIAAIEEMRIAMVIRHDAMCEHMQANHWQSLQQR